MLRADLKLTAPSYGLEEHPVIQYARENLDSTFLIFGRKEPRKLLTRTFAAFLREDPRKFNLTIDSINNPSMRALMNDCSFDEILLENLPETLRPFAKYHVEKVSAHTQVNIRQWRKNTQNDVIDIFEQHVIPYACESALIETCQTHNIGVFFLLDGINWNKLNTHYQDCYTTKELKAIYEALEAKLSISHITFYNNKEIVPHEEIHFKLKKAFAPTVHTAISQTIFTHPESAPKTPYFPDDIGDSSENSHIPFLSC